MDRRILKMTRVLLSTGAISLAAFGASVDAQLGDGSPGRDLEGAWIVTVTLTNCATGDALPIPPFYSLVSFSAGGTLLESSGSNNFAPEQRTPGHGTWTYTGGSTYEQHVINLIRFDSNPQPTPPLFAGAQMIDHTITMSDRNNFTSAGTVRFYRFNGQLYRTGCSKAVGQRFPLAQ